MLEKYIPRDRETKMVTQSYSTRHLYHFSYKKDVASAIGSYRISEAGICLWTLCHRRKRQERLLRRALGGQLELESIQLSMRDFQKWPYSPSNVRLFLTTLKKTRIKNQRGLRIHCRSSMIFFIAWRYSYVEAIRETVRKFAQSNRGLKLFFHVLLQKFQREKKSTSARKHFR